MIFSFTLKVEVERESGKFAPREEIEAEILDAIESADPGEIYVGADGDSCYAVVSWEVSG